MYTTALKKNLIIKVMEHVNAVLKLSEKQRLTCIYF